MLIIFDLAPTETPGFSRDMGRGAASCVKHVA